MSYPYNDEAEDRVIARALDADDTDEAAMDRATLDEYRRVLAHLPFDEIEPPAMLEDRVLEAALSARPATARSIARPTRRRAAARWATLGASVAAAAAVIAFMFATTGDNAGTETNADLIGESNEDAVTEVVEADGVREAPLENSEAVGQAALSPNGDGVLYDLTLPVPEPGQSLWLWLVTDGSVVPVGELDPNARIVAFDVTGDIDAVLGVSVTLEDGSGTPDTSGDVLYRATFEG